MFRNKLIEVVGVTSVGSFGIIETPMYPAMYYAGLYDTSYYDKDDVWPWDNSTCNYHRTVEEARKHCTSLFHNFVNNEAKGN